MLRDSKSALPRRSRTLLISIDGKTDSAIYAASLSTFGDVPALIESMLRAGLIAALPVRRRQPEREVSAEGDSKHVSIRTSGRFWPTTNTPPNSDFNLISNLPDGPNESSYASSSVPTLSRRNFVS